MPKQPDPKVRSALIEAAARIMSDEGPQALTTRRLADEVGTSTMAVYTHFSGMDELRRAVREEGFARFGSYLDQVEIGDDPIVELAELGTAYFTNAISNPHLYRFMFMERPLEEELEIGMYTFERLIAAVGRAVESGRFRPAEPRDLAMQLWVMAHGLTALYIVGICTLEEVIGHADRMAFNLFVAFGDDPKAARRSMDQGQQSRGLVTT